MFPEEKHNGHQTLSHSWSSILIQPASTELPLENFTASILLTNATFRGRNLLSISFHSLACLVSLSLWIFFSLMGHLCGKKSHVSSWHKKLKKTK